MDTERGQTSSIGSFFFFKVLLISSRATEHGEVGPFARRRSSGNVLGVIQAHAIRYVRRDPRVSGERGSERRRSDGWTAGKVCVGTEG
jgi:hypothetical protein